MQACEDLVANLSKKKLLDNQQPAQEMHRKQLNNLEKQLLKGTEPKATANSS